MAENWWDSYKRTDEEDNWWESYKRADEPAPSAGGGRGFVNPPRVFEKQPVRSAPPAPVEPTDYGQASTDMMGTPMSQAGPGLIQRVGAALRPAPTPSVMDGFVPPAPSDRERQAEIDRRLSYGAGPISPKVVRSADDLRNARQSGGDIAFRDQAYGATVNRVADAMDRGGQLSSGQVVENTNRKMIRDMVTDDKAAEFRSVGEWAVDSLSTVASGVVTLAQLPVNILSPGSDLADSLRQTQKELEAENSDVYKASRDSLRRRVESEEGFLGKYFSTVAELVSNPTLSVNEALKQIPMFLGVVGGARLVGSVAGTGVAVAGRVAPNVALADAIGGGAITAAARGAGSTVGGLGASMVMAGGDAAGNTYETLTKKTPLSEWQKNPDFQKLVSEGKPEEDAIEEIATAKARMAALITAPLGILGFMGAESAVVGRGVGRFAADALTPKGAAKLVAKENLTEQLEEGGTQAGSNLIASTVKRDQSLMEGVPEAMATAAVTSTPFGVIGAYSQYKAAQDQSVDPFTDYAARANLSTQNPDGTLIAPGQSARRPYDIGPSAPIRSGADGEINFTPQGSITAEAGLAPIVVPMGAGQQTGGVNGGLPDVLGGLAGGSGVAGGGDPLAGLGSPGRDAGLPGRGGANAQGALVGDGGLALPGAGAGQPGPSLAAGRGERATDADLLARAGQASEGAPAKIWAGRAGDGYAQQQDAQQAFPSLQRRYPDLSWSMQQDADGKFYWSGRSTGESNGSVAGAAGQGLAGVPGVGSAGQEADAGAGVVGFGPSRIGQPGQPGGASTVGSASPDGPAFTLNLAPPAPRQTVLRAITSVKSAQGVDIEFEAQSLTDQQKVASAMARLVGKTVTFYTHKAGPAAAVPNGFVLDGNDRDIFLDKSSNDGALFVMMHEGVHALPQPIREKLVETLKGLTKTDMRSDFATRFSYDINNDYQIDNEIAAFMTQAVSKRKDFWQELRTKMGDGDFVEVAKVIISKLDTFIRGANQAYGEDFLKRYATDAVGVRDAVSTAYAQAMKAQGLQETAGAAGTGVSPSNRAADVNPMGMYSELARKIDAGPGQAMPDQWRGYIRGLTTKGVKPDEIEWSGVEDFISLKGGKVSKQEVADYLKQGGVKVEETVLGKQPQGDSIYLIVPEGNGYNVEAGGQLLFPDPVSRQEAEATVVEMKSGDEAREPDPTKYSEYTLPGGENYREVLLKLPTKKIKPFVDPHSEFTRRMLERYGRSWDRSMTSDERSEEQRLARESDSLFTKAAEESQRGSYQSSHWSQSNVLAHIRVNDRTDADGKRVLFVEELQSDWGQEGKKQGFASEADWEVRDRGNGTFAVYQKSTGKRVEFRDGTIAFTTREAAEAAIREKDPNSAYGAKSGVPTAPFVTKTEGWLNLALKRVMVMAAEGGYDKVAFVNGEQSADRYDLSKQVSRVTLQREQYAEDSYGPWVLSAEDKGGRNALDKELGKPEDAEEYIGKEVTQRLIEKLNGGNYSELSGLDLKVGGEGMKAFYDTIVPTALKKLLPKVGGGQMEMVGVNIGDKEAIANWKRMAANSSIESAPIKEFETQPGFDITPAMREKVATTGLPMFSKKVTEGADGAATAGAQGIASAPRSEVERAEDYERENGILPYTSEGQIEVPVQIQLSVKLLGKYEQHPILDIPVNKNGTVTLYYPTTNEEARRVARDKTLKASPGSNRIYLTNESSAPKVMNQRGNIEQRLEGANVLVQVDPSLLQLDMEHSDGRKDFFIPLAEGKEFFNKMRMTRLFTQNAPRSKALTKDTRLTDLERRISDGIDKYVGLTKSEQRIRLKEAKSVLSREHNVTTLLGVNGKLEKTNTGGYGLNNYDGKDVKSMGLGLASAQKINEQNLSTCPKSAICEGLCLGETSGQNKLYGGDGQYRSGPRLSQYLKTEAMVVHPEEFAVVLHSEIAKLERNANKEDYQATVRLNVTSDFRPQTFKAIISAFPDVVFYDYTKLPTKSIASNHHLTYSSTGASQVVDGKTIFNPESNWNKMVAVLGRGDNVAMAFSDKTTMPKYVVDGKTGERFQVWNGDNYDARFLDPKPGATGNEFNKGMVIGLTNKDRTVKPELAAKKNQGFFIDYNPERDGDTITIKDQDALASDRKTIAIKLAPSEVEGKAGDAPIASNRVTENRAAPAAKPPTPATIIVGGRTLRIPDPAGAVETLDAKINRYSELLKCLQ